MHPIPGSGGYADIFRIDASGQAGIGRIIQHRDVERTAYPGAASGGGRVCSHLTGEIALRVNG